MQLIGRARFFLFAAGFGLAQAPQAVLWNDVTKEALGTTAAWTNKVEIADLNGDGRPDLLFANGGNYSEPGAPEVNGAFFHTGQGFKFEDRSGAIFGKAPGLARVIKARDVNGDGLTDILVGNTYQTQSRLYLGTGKGAFDDVTPTHLPRSLNSIGDLELGDVDGDGDLDAVLADWGAGNNMTNDGGRMLLWVNDGRGRFSDGAGRMPTGLIRFSWDIELADTDNDYDLDLLVSCKRCANSTLYRNDGHGTFAEDPRAMPQYTNNYEFEPMDLDGDGFLDLVTINDGDIVGGNGSSRREHVFRNDGKGRFRDVTDTWWPDAHNVGEDDNMVAFLDVDSDGDADFVVGSLSGPDRLLRNDGKGNLTVDLKVFDGEPTPGTLGLALADLDGDGRMDVIQAQGEHPKATDERIFAGRGLAPDKAPPSITLVSATDGALRVVRARVHDRKSPSLATEWKKVVVEWTTAQGAREVPMQWYGEYLWRAAWPSDVPASAAYRVCATDAAGNSSCSPPPTK
ncbi:MAG TPA: VCBS repeat-containing protein [Vicinamibacterales bacterium]|nr:VCBS repeat-containing protein [Vicinamibacterales bacterium]